MKKILITGANRGIGLELVKQLVDAGEFVFAGCRNPENAMQLQDLANIHVDRVAVVALDVTNDASVAAAKTAVAAQTDHLDIIINNAGILVPNETVANFDPGEMDKTFQVNVIGPMRIISQFVDLLQRGNEPKLVNVSSQLGSLEKMQTMNWGDYSYNASKAALNMLTRKLSHELSNIVVITLHPGWVQTDMGGKSAAITIPDSARGIIEVIRNLRPQDTNKFYTYAGVEHPW